MIWEKFNTYRFADYMEQVIDLLKRVTTVSVGSRPASRDGGGERDGESASLSNGHLLLKSGAHGNFRSGHQRDQGRQAFAAGGL